MAGIVAKDRWQIKLCNSHLTRNIFNLYMRRFFFGLVYGNIFRLNMIYFSLQFYYHVEHSRSYISVNLFFNNSCQSLMNYTSIISVYHFVMESTFGIQLGESVTVVPTKSDSDVVICLQSYQGFRIDRSLVY